MRESSLVAGGTSTGNVLLWEACTGKLIQNFAAHSNAVPALALGALSVGEVVVPLAGAAANITLLSHENDLNIGVNVDPAAVADPERFTQMLGDAYAELLDLA